MDEVDTPDLAVDIRGISKSFGNLRAIDALTMQIHRGEILGIAGPNGAGKSTLFNLISKVPFGPDSGTISIDGNVATRLTAQQIVSLGVCRTWQAESTFPMLTVAENTQAVARKTAGSRAARRTLVSDALATVGLAADAPRVSGGLPLFGKKRLALATALVTRPQTLLLDEPASGLNPDELEVLGDLISTIHKQVPTIVIVEHVLPLLQRLASRLVVMAAGKVLTEGPPGETLKDDRVVEAYIGRVD